MPRGGLLSAAGKQLRDRRRGDLTVFQSSAILVLLKSIFQLLVGFRVSVCVIVQTFVAIGQIVAHIWRFFDL